jgi:hypothetical protein
MPINRDKCTLGPGLFFHQEWAYISIMYLCCNWFFMSLVTLLPWIESDAFSMSQWAQLGGAAIGHHAWVRITSACRYASLFILSSLVNGRSTRYDSPMNQWKLNAIPLHHRTIRSWVVTMRSQSYFVLLKILSDFGLLAVVTVDSLSHMNVHDTCPK